jgi:hypothetical protein
MASNPSPTVSFVGGNSYITGLGDQNGSGFDVFFVTGTTVSNLALPGTAIVGSFGFDSAANCGTCTPVSGVAAISLDVNGYGTQDYDVPYTWSSTATTHSLAFGPIAPLTFSNSAGSSLDFVFQPLGTVTTTTGGFVGGNIDAKIALAAPETETYTMMLAGLGMIALVVRRRSALLGSR